MTSPTVVPEPVDADYRGEVKIQGSLRRLLVWIVPANFVIFVVWGAVPGLLLALQVGAFDEANMVGNLAIVTTLGAFSAMIAQPVAGLVSDRTRSRFGRRAPWIVVGTVVGGVALILLGFQSSLIGMAICWMIVQIAYNFAQGPLSAIMPDRVPVRARGTFAAVTGVGTMVGLLGGQFIGSAFRNAIPLGYTVLAVAAVVVAVLFTLLNPDRSNREQEREAFTIRQFLSTFWVNPIAHPDFFWAFVGRFLLNAGYNVVSGYQLYILANYLGLGLDDAAVLVPLLAITAMVPLVIGTLIAGPLSDRLDRRRFFVFIGGALMAVSLVVPWMWPTVPGMFLFAAGAGLGQGLFQSVDTALMSEVLPSKETFAKDLGVINIAATLPQTVSPAIAGAVVLTLGYSALFPVGLVLCGVGAFAVWMIRGVR